MKRITFSLIHIRARPAAQSRGLLRAGTLSVSVALGRAGIRANKREGDGATPRGKFHPVQLWWRADRLAPPRTFLPLRPIGRVDAWCEDPTDRRYNRRFRRSANEPGDRLWREDRLYDLVMEIDHNSRPRIAGRGSGVFFHLARPAYAPTAGCVALALHDFRLLLSRIGPKTRIWIQI